MPSPGSRAWQQAGGPCRRSTLTPQKKQGQPPRSQPARSIPVHVRGSHREAPSPPAAICTGAFSGQGSAAAFVDAQPACCQASMAAAEIGEAIGVSPPQTARPVLPLRLPLCKTNTNGPRGGEVRPQPERGMLRALPGIRSAAEFNPGLAHVDDADRGRS